MPDDKAPAPDRPHVNNPDYRPAPYNHAADKPGAVIEREIQERRIAAENAHYERGFPVAGHDFRREANERERER